MHRRTMKRHSDVSNSNNSHVFEATVHGRELVLAPVRLHLTVAERHEFVSLRSNQLERFAFMNYMYNSKKSSENYWVYPIIHRTCTVQYRPMIVLSNTATLFSTDCTEYP